MRPILIILGLVVLGSVALMVFAPSGLSEAQRQIAFRDGYNEGYKAGLIKVADEHKGAYGAAKRAETAFNECRGRGGAWQTIQARCDR